MANETNRKSRLSIASLFLLALLGVPRVIAHDLHWIDPGSIANSLLVFIPPILWLIIVLYKREAKPFRALLMIGIFYGLLLGFTHQLTWNASFTTPPTLGGNLADISPLANSIITRSFAFISSIFTGVVVGLITGFAGFLINRVMNK